MSNILTLENAQNIGVITRIFAKRPISELKQKNPLCIVLVGSPGVGKTTQAKHYLMQKGLDYDKFYNISLDSIVERVKPYRNTTMRLYNRLKSKDDLSILDTVYLPTIMSHDRNYSLSKTEKSRINKIVSGAGLKKKKKFTLKNLIELRRDGFIYGVKNGLNILYDTTLARNKDKIITEIMPVIEMSPIKYKIKVILVVAPEDIIKNRLKTRKNKMLSEKEPYIRSINPKAVQKLILDNIIGYENSKKYFTSGRYEKDFDTQYKADDFEFEIIDNSTTRATTTRATTRATTTRARTTRATTTRARTTRAKSTTRATTRAKSTATKTKAKNTKSI